MMNLPGTLSRLTPILLTLLLAVSACTTSNNRAARQLAESVEPLTTGETLRALQTLNNGQIEQAEMALDRTDRPEVTATAQLILRDHQFSNRRIDALQSRIQLEESELSRTLQTESEELVDQLAALSGDEFDCTYLEKQIELHRGALQMAQTDLMPEDPSPQIEEMMTETMRMLEQHRESARINRLEILECPPLET